MVEFFTDNVAVPSGCKVNGKSNQDNAKHFCIARNDGRNQHELKIVHDLGEHHAYGIQIVGPEKYPAKGYKVEREDSCGVVVHFAFRQFYLLDPEFMDAQSESVQSSPNDKFDMRSMP